MEWTCVLYSARWCDPGIPMTTIFDEVVRDLGAATKGSFSGFVVDVDDEEDDHINARPGTHVSADALASVDFVPMIVLYRGEPSSTNEVTRLTGQLPKLVVREELLRFCRPSA